MKRTAEIVIGIIGVVVYGFTAIMGGAMLWMRGNEATVKSIYDDVLEKNPGLEIPDYQTFLDSMGAGATILIVVSVVAMLCGIIAMIFLKGNKRPKAAGILFIASAAIVVILPLGISSFSSVFYLTAGIMSLVRKPKEPIATL